MFRLISFIIFVSSTGRRNGYHALWNTVRIKNALILLARVRKDKIYDWNTGERYPIEFHSRITFYQHASVVNSLAILRTRNILHNQCPYDELTVLRNRVENILAGVNWFYRRWIIVCHNRNCMRSLDQWQRMLMHRCCTLAFSFVSNYVNRAIHDHCLL